MIAVFRFDDRDRNIRLVEPKEVGSFGFAAFDCLPAHDDTIKSEAVFLADLGNEVRFLTILADDGGRD